MMIRIQNKAVIFMMDYYGLKKKNFKIVNFKINKLHMKE